MPKLMVLLEQLLAPVPGGAGRYSRELTKALAATAPAGWTVGSAIARHADATAAIIPGVEGPHRLPLPRRALVAAWESGIPMWPGGDTVHAPTPLAPPGSNRGRELVVSVHDTVPWTHPGALTRRGAGWHRRMIGRAARRASALVVPTTAVGDELARLVPCRALVHVVGEGVTAAVTRPPDDAGAIVTRLGLPPRYVLAIGTLELRKGIDTLLAAMAIPGAPDLPVVHSDAPALVEVAGGAGMMVPRGRPAALATALRAVLLDAGKAQAMVAAGRRRAERFSWERTAARVWSVHLELRPTRARRVIS